MKQENENYTLINTHLTQKRALMEEWKKKRDKTYSQKKHSKMSGINPILLVIT